MEQEVIECGMNVRIIKINIEQHGLMSFTDYEIENGETRELKNEVHY